MSLPAAAAAAGGLVVLDYTRRLEDSSVCQFLREERERQQGTDLVVNVGYELLCEPYEDPPLPPSVPEFENAGGVPCRLYRVTYESGDSQGNSSTSQGNLRGPIRLVKSEFSVSGERRKVFWLQGGNGIDCPLEQTIAAASSNIDVIDVYATILSIEPLEGDPATEIPVLNPNPPGIPEPPPPFGYNIEVNIDGVDVDVQVNFEPVINTNIGPVIPFTFAPSANFNLPVNNDPPQLPRFGIDLNLEVVVSLQPGAGNPTINPDVPPVTVDPPALPPGGEGEGVDYELIRYIVEQASCCKPINGNQFIATRTFQTDTDVFTVDLPDNTVAVFLAIIPGQNTRVYKTNDESAEFGHGNASTVVNGNVTEFVRLYVNNHVLFFDIEDVDKAVRVSLQKGSVVNITAGTYTPPPPPENGISN
jgi:hypothetical protein